MSDRRPWEQSYPDKIKNYHLDPKVMSKPITDFVDFNALAYGENTAYTFQIANGACASLSYKDIQVLSSCFARFLKYEKNLSPGSVVAVQLPNCLHYPIAVFGAWKAGLIVTNVNPLYTERELVEQVSDCNAKLLIACDFSAELVDSVCEPRGIDIVLVSLSDFFTSSSPEIQDVSGATFFSSALEIGGRFPPNKVDHHAVALYQYTGGTTGKSKGAVLTHANLRSVLEMAEDYLESFDVSIEPSDTIVTALPMYHIFAFNINFLLFFKGGAHNILIPNPRPLINIMPAFKRNEVKWITGVDTLYSGMLDQDWFVANPPSLKLAIAGGSALRASTAERWSSMVGPILEGYGLTETSCFVAFNPPGSRSKAGTVGLPLPGSDVKIVDVEGNPVPEGVAGELLVSGPHVMQGYLNRPDEDRAAFAAGWFRTGDIAILDEEGYIKIVDRKKDMILVSGFNVYPNEIEDVLAGHPDVLEVAVIGVPDAQTGEAIKAFVKLANPGFVERRLIDYCREKLTAYKVPKQISFIEDLPKSPVGKVLRSELRKLD